MFGKFGRFFLEANMVYRVLPPLFIQDGKYFYPDDPLQPNGLFPVGLNPNREYYRAKGNGSYSKELIYKFFYSPETRRLVQITTQGIDQAMKLTEDIKARKQLLKDVGIFTNPYNLPED